MALGDLSAIAGKHETKAVSVLGVAIGQTAEDVQARLSDAKATFPQLLDSQGTAFDLVGKVALPQIFVLDGQRKIVWFDIEYSQSTYRELLKTLDVLTAGS